MSRYAEIQGGKVTNVVEITKDEDGNPTFEAPKGTTLVESETANIGDKYSKKKFTPVAKPVVKSPSEEYAELPDDASRLEYLAKRAGLVEE